MFASSRYIRVHPAPRPGDPHETSLVEAFGGSGGLMERSGSPPAEQANG